MKIMREGGAISVTMNEVMSAVMTEDMIAAMIAGMKAEDIRRDDEALPSQHFVDS